MKRAIAKEWLWLLSMLILGAIVAPLILYGFSTYHYDYFYYTLHPRANLHDPDELPLLPPKVIYDASRDSRIYDSVVTNFNNRLMYDWLTDIYDIGTFDEFSERMKEPVNRQYLLKMLITWDFGEHDILQAVRINESGYKVFYLHIRTASHYLLLLGPYLVCLLCRFTYWSVRTALAKGKK